MNQELPDVQAGFIKTEESEIKLSTTIGSQKKTRELKKKKRSTSDTLTKMKPLTVWTTINCGKFLEMGITDHLTCLLGNLYAGQEETVRIEHGTTD